MKSIMFLICCACSVASLNVFAQGEGQTTPKYRGGIGLQYTSPAFGISGKLGISEHSALQGIVNPFSAFVSYAVNSASGRSSSTYYGVRYIYRFSSPGRSHPYAFGGLGLMTWTAGSSFTGNWTGAGTTSGRYSVGGGYDFIFSSGIGLSGELSFGNMSTSPITGKKRNTLAIGVGVHLYSHPAKSKASKTNNKPRKID